MYVVRASIYEEWMQKLGSDVVRGLRKFGMEAAEEIRELDVLFFSLVLRTLEV